MATCSSSARKSTPRRELAPASEFRSLAPHQTALRALNPRRVFVFSGPFSRAFSFAGDRHGRTACRRSHLEEAGRLHHSRHGARDVSGRSWYVATDAGPLTMDVYYPAKRPRRRDCRPSYSSPATTTSATRRRLGCRFKDMGMSVSWGQLRRVGHDRDRLHQPRTRRGSRRAASHLRRTPRRSASTNASACGPAPATCRSPCGR